MFEYLEFRSVDGKRNDHDLKLFILTTCAHCERALAYLAKEGVAYRVVYGDELPVELKRRLRNDFVRSFHSPVRYPSLVIDDSEMLAGFEQIEWDEALRAAGAPGRGQ